MPRPGSLAWPVNGGNASNWRSKMGAGDGGSGVAGARNGPQAACSPDAVPPEMPATALGLTAVAALGQRGDPGRGVAVHLQLLARIDARRVFESVCGHEAFDVHAHASGD